jgi:hypothetical protein
MENLILQAIKKHHVDALYLGLYVIKRGYLYPIYESQWAEFQAQEIFVVRWDVVPSHPTGRQSVPPPQASIFWFGPSVWGNGTVPMAPKFEVSFLD